MSGILRNTVYPQAYNRGKAQLLPGRGSAAGLVIDEGVTRLPNCPLHFICRLRMFHMQNLSGYFKSYCLSLFSRWWMFVRKLSWTSFGGSARSWGRVCKCPVSNVHQHSGTVFSSNLQWSFHTKGELSLQGSDIHSRWHSHSFRVWAPRIQHSWSRIRDMDQKEDWSRGKIWPFCRRPAATP